MRLHYYEIANLQYYFVILSVPRSCVMQPYDLGTLKDNSLESGLHGTLYNFKLNHRRRLRQRREGCKIVGVDGFEKKVLFHLKKVFVGGVVRHFLHPSNFLYFLTSWFSSEPD